MDEDDLDQPLYRVYPIWFFEMALVINGGNLALVRPTTWEDPQEDPCALIQMAAPGGKKKLLSDYLSPTYAQCWSMDGSSDALLRAYSRVSKDSLVGRNTEPKFEGVRVCTTTRIIIDALEEYLGKRRDDFLDLFVAKIAYVDEPFQAVVDLLGQIGPTRLGMGFDRARSLTFKRKAFEHEQEVRIIALARPGTTASVILANINRNQVFQEISFDPRLAGTERDEREARVRALGYTGHVKIDSSYAKKLILAHLPMHWDALDASVIAK